MRIGYRTNEGQFNEFELDIVYALPAQMMSIPSPISEGATIVAATVENIIADKLAASQRFKGGNTRMKDFDDLWRISKSLSFPIDWKILRELLANRGISPALDLAWINDEMEMVGK